MSRFCNNDHWELYKTSDHDYYRKRDADGNIRHVKVSRSSGDIHGHLWREILKKQLCVTQEYFNSKI